MPNFPDGPHVDPKTGIPTATFLTYLNEREKSIVAANSASSTDDFPALIETQDQNIETANTAISEKTKIEWTDIYPTGTAATFTVDNPYLSDDVEVYVLKDADSVHYIYEVLTTADDITVTHYLSFDAEAENMFFRVVKISE